MTETTVVSSLTVLKDDVQSQGVSKALLVPKVLGKSASSPLLEILAFLGLYRCHSTLCLLLHMAFSPVCRNPPLLMGKTVMLELGPTLMQDNLILA